MRQQAQERSPRKSEELAADSEQAQPSARGRKRPAAPARTERRSAALAKAQDRQRASSRRAAAEPYAPKVEADPWSRPQQLPFKPIAIGVAAVALVGILAFANPFASPEGDSGPSDMPEEAVSGEDGDAASEQRAYQDELNNFSSEGYELTSFALFGDEPAQIPEDTAEKAQEALSAIITGQGGTAGAVLLDEDSGRGIAINADTDVYGASAYKVAYLSYLLSEKVEKGKASLDSSYQVTYDYTDEEPNIDPGTYTLRELIEAVVRTSDDNAMQTLRHEFDDADYAEWFSRFDFDYDAYSYCPYYTARELAKFWGDTEQYLESGTPEAAWLDGLLYETNVSYIRDGVEATGAQVRNKAGWYHSSTGSSTTDGALITLDGHTYVMTIMTDLPDTQANRDRVAALAEALFEARTVLSDPIEGQPSDDEEPSNNGEEPVQPGPGNGYLSVNVSTN